MESPAIVPEGPGVHRQDVSSFEQLGEILPQLHQMPAMDPEGPRTFIYRGQFEKEEWKLEPKLDRCARKLKVEPSREYYDLQLERFKQATRGQMNPFVERGEKDKDEWWAVGQHYGLATPFLDWTESPYVAAFFAFREEGTSETTGRQSRVVYALFRGLFKDDYVVSPSEPPRKAPARLVVPKRTRSERIVVQQGLFTQTLQPGKDMEALVRERYAGARSDATCLVKLVFAEEIERDDVLLRLGSMNVTHRTLFPDLAGAAQHCNLALEIENY